MPLKKGEGLEEERRNLRKKQPKRKFQLRKSLSPKKQK
jgi:hypothetical protein